MVLLCSALSACRDGPTDPPSTDTTTSVTGEVVVFPPVLTIEPDGEMQLAATVLDSTGRQVLDVPVTWTANRHAVVSVTDGGLLKALSEGSAVATANTSAGVGRAYITVTPPATRFGTGPNDPDGFVAAADRDFSSIEASGWVRKVSTHFEIAQDADAPVSGPMVAEAVYPTGWEGAFPPVATDRWIEDRAFRRVYLSFAVKLSENWQGGANGQNIFGYIWLGGNPGVVPTYAGSAEGPLVPQVRLHGTPMPPDGAVNLAPNVSEPVIERGEWHRWEVLLVLNQGKDFDGEVHWWIDGQKAGEYTGIAFTGDPGPRAWQYVTWRPIWSTEGDMVRETMSMKLDHYYVSGRRW